jgi:hypothetical protein
MSLLSSRKEIGKGRKRYVCLSACKSVSLYVCLSVFLTISLSAFLSAWLYVCLFVCVFLSLFLCWHACWYWELELAKPFFKHFSTQVLYMILCARLLVAITVFAPLPGPHPTLGWARFAEKIFSLISEIKLIWIRFTCVSLFHYKISLLFFRFKFFTSLHLSNFCFEAKQSESKFKSIFLLFFFAFFTFF